MKRFFVIVLVGLVALILFVCVVHGVLFAAHLSQPSAVTVHGVTLRRLWATSAAALALIGVFSGGMASYRASRRLGNYGRRGAIVALVVGPIAGLNGWLNLAVATGGPGSGNGVIGGAAALVLGLIAVALGGAALARSRRVELGECV